MPRDNFILDDYPFLIDHLASPPIVWVPLFKGGSESMRDAIGDYMKHPPFFETPRRLAHHYVDYLWLMTGVRDPRDKARSWWEASVPAKPYKTLREAIEALRDGTIDSRSLQHLLPATALVEGIKPISEIKVIYLKDLSARADEVRGHFRYSLPIGHLNTSPKHTDWRILFENELTPELCVWLEHYYRNDLDAFGYDRHYT